VVFTQQFTYDIKFDGHAIEAHFSGESLNLISKEQGAKMKEIQSTFSADKDGFQSFFQAVVDDNLFNSLFVLLTSFDDQRPALRYWL
jgi:hypothetical protein